MKPVFISYATSDRKEALAVCEAIERRGVPCWIACRDVQPGENYQEAIVRSIRGARAMVLVFSDRANNSDEIKKEMSLVSRFHVPMLALRIEDVEPGDAFAYELATRQWIDLFEDWDKSIDALVARVATLQETDLDEEAPAPRPAAVRAVPPPLSAPRRGLTGGSLIALAVAAVVLIAIAGGSWFFLRGSRPKAEHSMQVRWTGFQRLSPDLPATMPDAMRDETIAAFSDDGVVGISIAAAPPPGDAPAYALGGTIRRDGDQIRVIARLTNERSGATLWSNDFSYPATDQARIPRRVAIDAGNLLRCGLFGASTYSRALPDPVLTAYLGYCRSSELDDNPGKALDSAHKVVAAAPDFSWGWSAVQSALMTSALEAPSSQWESLLAQAREAGDKAVALDPTNSEALSNQSWLLDPNDLQGREALLQRSLKARPLACGCEHHFYGLFLQDVGRWDDAIAEYRRGIDVLALNDATQFSLAKVLLMHGDIDGAKPHVDAWIDLNGQPERRGATNFYSAFATHDYAAALAVVRAPPFPIPADRRAAWQAGFAALVSGNPAAKADAVQLLTALPLNTGSSGITVDLLGALGANAEALRMAEQADASHVFGSRSWLFEPAMAGARADPAFAGVADRLGLTHYWKATHTKPDFCKATAAPAYCKTL